MPLGQFPDQESDEPDRGAGAYQFTAYTIYDPLVAWEMDVADRPGKLVPGLATIWTAWAKFNVPVAPDPLPLTLAGLGALIVNLSCAYMLARFRHHSGSLTRAAFLSARNDAFANIAIIAAGLVTAAIWHSAWPDLIVGLAIALLNADAARAVWQAARKEHRAAT